MTGVLMILVLGVLTIGGFMVGAAVARKNGTMSRSDRRELLARRRFMDDLTGLAAEHVALGDPFAVIVLDEHREFRNQIEGKNR